MTANRALWTAATAGVVMEALCFVVLVVFGQVGPCGPGNNVGGVIFMLHAPGNMIAEMFPEEVQLPIILLATAAMWSAVVLIVMAPVRVLYVGVVRSAAQTGRRD